MKVKFLKDLYSVFGHYLSGEVHVLEHDKKVIENWIEQGYCEISKAKTKKDGE
jgi:hypothetical protein